MNAEESMTYDILVGDVNVTNKVTVYSGQPAIFAVEAPGGAVLPYIVFNTVSVAPWDTHTEVGYDTLLDIRCYVAREGSAQALNSLSAAARAAMHRQRPTHAGLTVAGTLVTSGPDFLGLEEHAMGQVITVRFLSANV